MGSALATMPGPRDIASGSSERDAEEGRFQRLERVRAQQRSRRQHRLILISALALALAGVGVLGFSAVRRALLEHHTASALQAPRSTPAAPVVPVPVPTRVPPTTGAPAPARGDTARAEVATPRRVPLEPPRSDPRTPDAGDGAAAIDWLLGTSRTKGR